MRKALLVIELPTSCFDCPCSHFAYCRTIACGITGKTIPAPNCEETRLDSCPLIHVPPHGDLIDRDAAAEKIWDDMRFPSNLANAQFFVNELREMPTIIQAEEDEQCTRHKTSTQRSSSKHSRISGNFS